MIRDIVLNPWWGEGLMLQRKADVRDLIETSAKIGADGIDMQEGYLCCSPNPDLLKIHEYRNIARANGLKINSCWFYTDTLGAVRASSLQKTVDYLKRDLLITAMFESPYLVIQHGEPGKNQSYEDAKDTLFRVYDELVPLAEQYQVKVCFEAARILSPFNSPEGALALIREYDSHWITLTPDFEAWRKKNESMTSSYVENPGMTQPDPLPISVMEKCLPNSRYVHAKFLYFDENGEEPNYPERELLQIIENYEKPVDLCIEYEGWLPEIHPELAPAAEVKKAFDLVASIRGHHA